MGGAYPCYGCALNSLMDSRIHADGKIHGVGIMRTIGTDHKTENVKNSPTYEECEMKFQTLLGQIDDIESETYRSIWFIRVRALRRDGCWKHASELIKIARSHDLGKELNPILGLIRNNGYIRGYSNRYISNSNVLSKEEQVR